MIGGISTAGAAPYIPPGIDLNEKEAAKYSINNNAGKWIIRKRDGAVTRPCVFKIVRMVAEMLPAPPVINNCLFKFYYKIYTSSQRIQTYYGAVSAPEAVVTNEVPPFEPVSFISQKVTLSFPLT